MKIKLSMINDLPVKNPGIVFDRLITLLNPVVNDVYDTLARQGHFNNEKLTTIVTQFFKEIEGISDQEQDQIKIIAFTVLCDQLFTKAINYDTYQFRQNRFLAFFNEVLQVGYPTLKKEALKANNPFYDWYTSYLYQQITEGKHEAFYEKLTATWLLCDERETVLSSHAKRLLDINKNHYYFVKLASLLYLQGNDGARSLSLLRGLSSTLHYRELIDHFLIMEQKKDFTMMKHWFDLFFRHEKPKQGTILHKLYEEMLFELGTPEEKITIVWGNWLNSPSFKTYKTNMKKMSQDEKSKVLDYLIPKLQENLFRSQTEAIYYQIIAEEELFAIGIDSLLSQKKEVTVLTPEIENLLSIMLEKKPGLLLPFYHQLVERLVQMKSRVHYEDATIYIQRLKVIYSKLNKQETFKSYIIGLKQRYKTFRAFIQELKKIDH